MFNLKQTDEGRHDLFDGKSGKGVLIAHDEDLAHLDDCLQLLALIASCLKALKQLLSFANYKKNYTT